MKTAPVNWEEYNEPPFLPQWMCEDETLLTAKFDDSLNLEAERQIRLMVDQYDLDHAEGALLDRIGKMLFEARDGDTDSFYRIRLKVKKLMNTSNGSINDIIKIAKVLYSGEDIHIEANYPAGVRILHDGEGTPGLDFNRILRAVVAAGVSYNTTELFNFIEELFSTDSQLVKVRHNPKEEFECRIYHSRRIRRDGHTILPTELKKAYHSGTNRHNGNTRHNGQYETGAASYIKLPIVRESGYLEQAFFGLGTAMKDFQFSRLFRNGSIRRKTRVKRNGEFRHNGGTNRMPFTRHNGRSPYSINDTISIFDLKQPTVENFLCTENSLVNLTVYDGGQFRKPYNRDGTYRHNTAIFHSGRALDFLSILQKIFLQETAAGSAYHNNTITRDGSENHRGSGIVFAYEKQIFKIGLPAIEAMPTTESQTLKIENDTAELVSKFYRHNSSLARDGTFMRDSRINDRLLMKAAISPALSDTQSGRLLRNKSITRMGSEYHQSQRMAYDTFSAGIRYHHNHNGVYVRNNGIRHNDGVLIPLEDIA